MRTNTQRARGDTTRAGTTSGAGTGLGVGGIPLRAKLETSQPGDPLEQEADRAAEQVMSVGDAAGAPAAPAATTSGTGAVVHRQCGTSACACDDCQRDRDGQVMREAAGGGAGRMEAPGIVHDVLGTPGQPLDGATRAFMEPRFGHDFSRVRVHSDERAGASAHAVRAHAYAVGQDIVFAPGRYAPQTREGRHLLAHELAHTRQADAAGIGRASVMRQSPTGSGSPPPAPAPTSAPGGGLSDPMLEQLARQLRAAMDGWGTDESAIYAALGGRTQDQVNAISAKYATLYPGRALMADLQDELSDDELRHLGEFNPQQPAGTPDSEADRNTRAGATARALRDAMDGWGTDESALFAALSGRTVDERTAIKHAYHDLTQRDLEADLRDELSGADLTRALVLLNDGMLNPEDELYLAMEGWGTDEETIFRVLDGMASAPARIRAMELAYRHKYGDLVADLRDDLSGGDYEHAMRVIGPVLGDVAFEQTCGQAEIDAVRLAVSTAIPKIDAAITMLAAGRSHWTSAQAGVFDTYFDPSSSGYDDGFVTDVLGNFRLLRRAFDQPTFQCDSTGGMCGVPNRYGFTYWGNIHLCPYFFTMGASDQVRGVIHELTHNALWAVDRAYEHEPDFRTLTPRGSWATRIPVLGPLIGLIARGDTLYNPDSYAMFANVLTP